jgi:hypothetical protein
LVQLALKVFKGKQDLVENKVFKGKQDLVENKVSRGPLAQRVLKVKVALMVLKVILVTVENKGK